MGTGIQTLANGLLNLFLKSNCPLCDRPAEAEWCESCQRQLLRCRQTTPMAFCQDDLPVFVWGTYGGTLKRAIATLKYNNHPQLARPMGQWLAQDWLHSTVATSAQKFTVIPIPLHSSKLQKRGYNQAQLIAQRFCEVTGYQHQPKILERFRETEAQFGLSQSEREQNLANAFVVGKSTQKISSISPVLLVDDIYTTGATIRSAAQTLRNRGIPVYGVVAIASSKQLKTAK
jgi:ComF family protein